MSYRTADWRDKNNNGVDDRDESPTNLSRNLEAWRNRQKKKAWGSNVDSIRAGVGKPKPAEDIRAAALRRAQGNFGRAKVEQARANKGPDREKLIEALRNKRKGNAYDIRAKIKAMKAAKNG